MFERVIVAIDWSEHSERALEAAATLAKLSGGTVRLLHVHEVARLTPSGPGPLADAIGDVANEELEAVKAKVSVASGELAASGATVTSEIRVALSGQVASEIVEEAGAWGADCVVIGTRGLSNIAGIIMGSTTNKVLNLTTLPVLVVR